MVCVRRRVSVRAMKTVSRMVILRSEMRTKTPSGSPLKGENPKSPFKGDLEGLCPGTQASPPAFKEVRSPGRTKSKTEIKKAMPVWCTQTSPPAKKLIFFWGGEQFFLAYGEYHRKSNKNYRYIQTKLDVCAKKAFPRR